MFASLPAPSLPLTFAKVMPTTNINPIGHDLLFCLYSSDGERDYSSGHVGWHVSFGRKQL
jgi:hypothetical protein